MRLAKKGITYLFIVSLALLNALSYQLFIFSNRFAPAGMDIDAALAAGTPRLCLVTGIHGDELEGQYLAFMVGSFIDKNIDLLDGIVDIYPALNPMGIDSITRGIPMFDLDMNRVFPGTKNGTMVEVVCSAITDDISGSDVCVDVHSSNIFLKEIPQIRISVPTAEVLLPYAEMMNIDFVWIHESATVL